MGLKILTVFDSQSATEWLLSALSDHDLTQVGTIMAAMHVLQREKVDVTLVQLHLQNESLFDLLRSIRRNDHYRKMSFICCDTAEPSSLTGKLKIEPEFVEKSCLLYGATRVISADEFYSEKLETQILETVAKPGSLSGT